MSYILEALKRSEQERHQGELAHATIDTIMMPAKQARHQWWPYLLIAVLAINFLVYLYFKLSTSTVESTSVVVEQSAPANESAVEKTIQNHSSTIDDSFLSQNEKPLPAHLLQTPKLTKRYDLNDHSRETKVAGPTPVKKKSLNADGLEVIKPKQAFVRISSEDLMTPQSKLDANTYKDKAQFQSESFESEQQTELKSLKVENFDDTKHLNDLDISFQKGIPNIRFNSHIYSSNPTDRRVMINDLYLREGQGFSGMTIETIGEFYIVLSKNSLRFKIPVLRDWFTPE